VERKIFKDPFFHKILVMAMPKKKKEEKKEEEKEEKK
jgi:hypothetical protein